VSRRASIYGPIALGIAVAAWLVPVAASADSASGAAPSSPADPGDLEALLGESVVTTVSRNAERASSAPATVFNITASEMMASGVRSVDEALEMLGLGVYVAKPRDYTSPIDVGAQGLLFRDGGSHVLVMLDGAILNSQGTGRISINEALGVPLEIIDHIEVMLGPGSVAYGSNAMLAVINVVTKRARDFHGVHLSGELGVSLAQDARGNPTSESGTRPGLRYRLSLGTGARFKVRGREGEITAMLEWVHEESATYTVTPFTTGDVQEQSFAPGTTTWGGHAAHAMRSPSGVVTVKLGDFRLVINAFDYYRSMPLSGIFADPSSRESQSGVRLDLRHNWDINRKLTLTSRLYGGFARFAESSSWAESYWCLPEHANGCFFERSANSGWAGIEQQLDVDWFANGKVLTKVGYDLRLRVFDARPSAYRDMLTGEGPTSVPEPTPQSTTAIGAFFLQQVWKALPWLTLNAGLRLDLDSAFGAKASPRAALVFASANTVVFRLSYNEAFRAPSSYELTEADATYRITPQNLKPETVRSAEAELQLRVARASLSLRGYASFYNDFIEARNATPSEIAAFDGRLSASADPQFVIVNDNIASLQVFGGSVSGQLRLPLGFHISGGFNIARAQDADGATYDRMPSWFGNFRAGWQGGENGYSVQLVGVYAAPRLVQSAANPTELRVGPRVDLRLTAAGPLGRASGLSWRASLGFAVNPELPYVLVSGTDSGKGFQLIPQLPRVFGFIGLHYAYSGF
jgi:outer membrane receptor for ferrienterochelin and colicins